MERNQTELTQKFNENSHSEYQKTNAPYQEPDALFPTLQGVRNLHPDEISFVLTQRNKYAKILLITENTRFAISDRRNIYEDAKDSAAVRVADGSAVRHGMGRRITVHDRLRTVRRKYHMESGR